MVTKLDVRRDPVPDFHVGPGQGPRISSQLFAGEKSLYSWMNTLVQAEHATVKNAAQPPVEKGKEPTDSIFRVTWNSVTNPVKKFFQ